MRAPLRRRRVAPITASTVRDDSALRGNLVVFELEPDPESLGSRTASEGFAAERIRISEFADEVHALNIAQLNCDNVAGGVQQFQFAVMDEIGRRNVTVDRIPVHLPDYDLFMGGRHDDWSKRASGAASRCLAQADSRTFPTTPPGHHVDSSQIVNLVLFSLACHVPSQLV